MMSYMHLILTLDPAHKPFLAVQTTKCMCTKISKNVCTLIALRLMCVCVCVCVARKATHSECAAWSFLRALSLAAPTGFPWSCESSGERKSREGSLQEISTAKTTYSSTPSNAQLPPHTANNKRM